MPRFKFVQIAGELIPVDEVTCQAGKAPVVIGDIKPYKSMVTGEIIAGRASHREHLRAHGVVEVGNDLDRATPKVPQPVGNLKETIARQVYEKLRY